MDIAALIAKYSTVSALFELVPIALSILATILVFQKAKSTRRDHDRSVMVLAFMSCVMLLVAQSSWWVTVVVDGSLEGTGWADVVWTLFNSTVMLTYIKMSLPRK